MSEKSDFIEAYVRPSRLRRSVLYVPASNIRAMEKSCDLNCDCVIYDLEDAVAPDQKAIARDKLFDFFKKPISDKEIIVRINGFETEWGRDDLDMVCNVEPNAVLVPKVSEPDDVITINEILTDMNVSSDLRLWAMIETARGVLNIGHISQYARTPGTRLDCLVVGSNDLIKETGITPLKSRPYLSSWLMQIVLAAKAYGLDVIDAVYNDFSDLEGFDAECDEARAMGFDGKTLIHPKQINIANQAFSIDSATLQSAQEIVDAFAKPEHANLGVIQINGQMVERLHLDMAEKLLEKAKYLKD